VSAAMSLRSMLILGGLVVVMLLAAFFLRH
jgi:hypothetical protein